VTAQKISYKVPQQGMKISHLDSDIAAVAKNEKPINKFNALRQDDDIHAIR
jgi:hypothetical protein